MLKTHILMFLITTFVLTSVKSQNTTVGFELGANVITIEKPDIGNNYQFGPYAGMNIRYELNNKISLSSGLFFSQRKKAYTRNDTSSVFSFLGGLLGGSSDLDSLINIPGMDQNVYHNTEGIVTENYIELPILVSYTINRFTINAGPHVGFLINGRKKEQTRTTTPLLQAYDIASIDSSGFLSALLPPADETTFSESTEIDDLRRIDYGASMGIGYTMDKVMLNLTYTMGFKDYRIETNGDEKNNHSSLRVSIIYFLHSTKTANSSL